MVNANCKHSCEIKHSHHPLFIGEYEYSESLLGKGANFILFLTLNPFPDESVNGSTETIKVFKTFKTSCGYYGFR